jgi:hypothetical protein
MPSCRLQTRHLFVVICHYLPSSVGSDADGATSIAEQPDKHQRRGSDLPSFIRHPKDFWTGIIFLCIGLAAVIIGRDYPMGTAGRMGPAYFPTVLGGLLSLIGLAAVVRSFFREAGEPIGKFAIKETILVLSAVMLFAFLIRGAGLVFAVVAIVLISALASSKFKWKGGILLAAGLAIFAIVVFIKLLGLPIAIFGPWLGG